MKQKWSMNNFGNNHFGPLIDPYVNLAALPECMCGAPFLSSNGVLKRVGRVETVANVSIRHYSSPQGAHSNVWHSNTLKQGASERNHKRSSPRPILSILDRDNWESAMGIGTKFQRFSPKNSISALGWPRLEQQPPLGQSNLKANQAKHHQLMLGSSTLHPKEGYKSLLVPPTQ